MKTLTILFIIFTGYHVAAQNISSPQVGKALPDYKLNDIRYSDRQEAWLSEYKGKWMFLELWFSGCPLSIKSLPVANELYKEFGKEMNFMLVGCTDPKTCFGDGLRDLYGRLQKKMNLEIPCAFDSLMTLKWNIWGLPRVFIIDPNGIVRIETDASGLTKERIRALLDGEQVSFPPAQGKDNPPEFTLGIEKNRAFLYNSTLMAWKGEKHRIRDITNHITYAKRPTYQASKVTLLQLYNVAFFGKAYLTGYNLKYNPLFSQVAFEPVLELADSSAFYDGQNLKFYNYSLNLPDSAMQEEEIKRALQKDLAHMLGFTATIEDREMPVWNLVATEEARRKLKTSGGEPSFSDKTGSGGAGGFTLVNVDINFLPKMLSKYIDDYRRPMLNATGITDNIDITIDALLTDFNDIQKELKRNGLQFVKDTKKMKVIVIRDLRMN